MKVLAVRWAGAPTHCVFSLNYSPALLQALLCCTPHYLSSLISPCGNGYSFGNVWCTSYIVCNRAKGVTLANPREKQSNFCALPSWKWRSHIQQRTVLLLVLQSHTSGIVGRLRCRQEVVPLGHLKQVLNCITAKGSYLKSLFWRLFTHIYAYTHTYKDPDQDEHLCLSPDTATLLLGGRITFLTCTSLFSAGVVTWSVGLSSPSLCDIPACHSAQC